MPQPNTPPAEEAAKTAETAETVAPAAEIASKELGKLGTFVDEQVEQWLPFLHDKPLLQGLAILLVFLLLSSIASVFLKRVVARILTKTKTDLDDIILSALTGPIYVTMLSIGMQIALLRMGLSGTPASIVASILATLIILSWASAAIKVVQALLSSLGRSGKVSILRPDSTPLFNNLVTIGIGLIAIYFLVGAWGGNVGGLLALGGVGGLVIGLAAQDTIGNLFAGIFIFADSPYKVGDYINLDSGERGMVTEIGIRSTRLLTRDDVEITIPNSVIAGAKIVNETGGPHIKYRIRIPVGVAYGSDLEQVRTALEEVAAEEQLAETDPAPRVRMRGFGASSLDFELLCWISEPELRGRAKDALFVRVYDKLNDLDIEIPFAKRDLYIKEMPDALSNSERAASGQTEDFIA